MSDNYIFNSKVSNQSKENYVLLKSHCILTLESSKCFNSLFCCRNCSQLKNSCSRSLRIFRYSKIPNSTPHQSCSFSFGKPFAYFCQNVLISFGFRRRETVSFTSFSSSFFVVLILPFCWYSRYSSNAGRTQFGSIAKVWWFSQVLSFPSSQFGQFKYFCMIIEISLSPSSQLSMPKACKYKKV